VVPLPWQANRERERERERETSGINNLQLMLFYSPFKDNSQSDSSDLGWTNSSSVTGGRALDVKMSENPPTGQARTIILGQN
jgi:hypothetical protein